MTLNTKFLTTSPGIDPEKLFDVLLDAGEPEDFAFRREDYIESGTDSVYNGHWPDQVTKNSRVGIGLKAWCFLSHKKLGSLTEAEYEDVHEDEPHSGCPPMMITPEHYIQLAFDTAYGYRGAEGSASGLHNVILLKLAAYVTEQGGTYTWQNEFTGDWFTDVNLDHLY